MHQFAQRGIIRISAVDIISTYILSVFFAVCNLLPSFFQKKINRQVAIAAAGCYTEKKNAEVIILKRWSKLQRQLYAVIDPTLDFQIHCAAYRMDSRRGTSDLPRYWITLNGEIIFDYPRQFVNDKGELKNLSPDARVQRYPYANDVSAISDLLRAYIDTPAEEIMTRHFAEDYWGLANILRAADKRIGARRLDTLRRRKGNLAAQKVIAARMAR